MLRLVHFLWWGCDVFGAKMNKEIPTPYVWTYQPQMGTAAGASQDYSTKINWLSAGNKMIQQVFDLRDHRNRLLREQALLTETPRPVMNPPTWPAHLLYHQGQGPVQVPLPRNPQVEQALVNSGAQLAGGSAQGIKLAPQTGYGIQLAESSGPVSVRSDGLFQLAGGSRSSFAPWQEIVQLQTHASVPRYGGLGSKQFVREFVPTVYLNPFSGPPDTYPDQFISNYDVSTHSIEGYL